MYYIFTSNWPLLSLPCPVNVFILLPFPGKTLILILLFFLFQQIESGVAALKAAVAAQESASKAASDMQEANEALTQQLSSKDEELKVQVETMKVTRLDYCTKKISLYHV